MVQTSVETSQFDEVYSANYAALVRLAYLTTGSMAAAEDVVQDVFIEWWRRRDQVYAPVVVFLRYYLDLPEAEIAAALRCRPGTVKSLLHRALSTLKEHLDEH